MVGAGLVLALGFSSWQYSHAFRDSETLWRDSLSKNPDAWLARFNLGRDLQHRGRGVEALEHYQRAALLERVSADDVRALIGVLATEPQTSKAILTTTAEFAPGIETCQDIMKLVPTRLELRDQKATLDFLVRAVKDGRSN